MYHFQETIADTDGDVRNGWFINLFVVGGNPDTAPAVTIYSDRAGTIPISGNRVKAIAKGFVEFYVPSGRYSRRYFDTAGLIATTTKLLYSTPLVGRLSAD
jgi:hypothetical protein